MRRHWIEISPEETLAQAHQTMRLARLRRMPVVDRGILVGTVTHQAVLEAWLYALMGRGQVGAERTPVERLMERSPEVLAPSDSLTEAARCIADRNAGFVPIVEPSGDGPRLVGVVTESDLLRIAYGELSSFAG